MQINEVCKATGLTKKAVAYSVAQGLVSPAVLENGYRDFTASDVARLHKIAVLRKLGVAGRDMAAVLDDPTGNALQTLCVQRELDVRRERQKKTLLEELSRGKPYAQISAALQALEQTQSIAERLLEAFPGYYGRLICLHFASFLREPIQSAAQQAAYERIRAFLDDMPELTFPQDLQEYLDESTGWIGTEQIDAMLQSTRRSIEDPERFFADNKESLEQYFAYRHSEEYRNSPACRLAALLREFNTASGFYDVFLPALKELSPSYAEYSRQLETANGQLLARHPELGTLES